MEILAGWYRLSLVPRRPACDFVPTVGSPFPAFYQMGALCPQVRRRSRARHLPFPWAHPPSPRQAGDPQGPVVCSLYLWWGARYLYQGGREHPLNHLPNEPRCASLMVGRDSCHHTPSIDVTGQRSQAFPGPHSVLCWHLNKITQTNKQTNSTHLPISNQKRIKHLTKVPKTYR